MNILYYGNCQSSCIKHILNLNKYNQHHIECYTTNLNKSEFDNIIKICDIIITQPILDNYREKEYLSTNYIVNNCKLTCKIIIFDSCHFDFYYFDLGYQFFNKDVLHQPVDYHYKSMVDCYKNNYTMDYYIENYVQNDKLKTSEELETIANNSLNELKIRYENNVNKYQNKNIIIISTYEFIKNNYKNKLLFYSMNHPTKYLIQYICLEIIRILHIPNTIDYDKDVLNNPKCIIYKAIQKNVNFDIKEYEPSLSKETDIKKIVKLYYDTYKKIGF